MRPLALGPPALPDPDVFITPELWKRPPKKTDYLQEKLALQDLAARMVDHPEGVLGRFVELAMQMTGGISAGLSLYEEEPAPGVFRWRHLCGKLATFEGATTPRDDSPCGITLDLATPVLTRHSERAYSWIAAGNITLPEVLLVPLFLGGPEPVGTLWIVSEIEGFFDSGHARATTELAAFVGIALRMQRSEERLKQALERQELLTHEMSHRLKNLFAVTEGMIRLGLRSADSKEDMARALSGRLQALASAHSLFLAGIADGSGPESLSFRALVEAVLRPHETGGAAARFSIQGPDVTCSERAITGLALVIYELATNAAKYGALTAEAGTVDISWWRDGDSFMLRWSESGGPCVAPPQKAGFGSKLVQSSIVGQFGGSVDYEWRSEGLIVTLALPARRFQPTPVVSE